MAAFSQTHHHTFVVRCHMYIYKINFYGPSQAPLKKMYPRTFLFQNICSRDPSGHGLA